MRSRLAPVGVAEAAAEAAEGAAEKAGIESDMTQRSTLIGDRKIMNMAKVGRYSFTLFKNRAQSFANPITAGFAAIAEPGSSARGTNTASDHSPLPDAFFFALKHLLISGILVKKVSWPRGVETEPMRSGK